MEETPEQLEEISYPIFELSEKSPRAFIQNNVLEGGEQEPAVIHYFETQKNKYNFNSRNYQI